MIVNKLINTLIDADERWYDMIWYEYDVYAPFSRKFDSRAQQGLGPGRDSTSHTL